METMEATDSKWARRPARTRRPVMLVGAVSAVAMLALFVAWAGADTPSDSRAQFVGGNATTCAAVGLPNATILFVDGNGNGANADVSGVVTNGTTLNVTVLNPNLAALAVVVKGGNGYNVYSSNVPDMISPFNNGGNLPTISHWFVCLGAKPATPSTPTAPSAPSAPAAAVTAPSRFTG